MLHYNQIVWIRLAHRLYSDFQYFFLESVPFCLYQIFMPNIWKNNKIFFLAKQVQKRKKSGKKQNHSEIEFYIMKETLML